MLPVRFRSFSTRVRALSAPAQGPRDPGCVSSVRIPPLVFLILGSLLLVSFPSCEAVFTYSPLAGLQRDPANLPTAQKITYAENALASGDMDAIRKAYAAIDDELQDGGLDAETEEELRLLALDLSLEASGIMQAALDLAAFSLTEESLSGTEAKARLDQALDTIIDLSFVTESISQIDAATAAGMPVSGTRMVLAGLGDVCRVADAEGGFASLGASTALDDAFQTIVAGVALLESEGASTELLGGLTTMLEFVGYP